MAKMHAQQPNGPSVGGASFVGGPKVHFPDADQDSGAEEDELEANIGKFERHDTPHPKHGPKPKGRQIDGHVIHHDQTEAAKVCLKWNLLIDNGVFGDVGIECCIFSIF